MGEFLIFSAIAAGAYLFSLYDQEAWKKTAADLGLAYSKKLLGAKSLHGRLRGFDVVVGEDSEKHQLVAEVHGIDPYFTLRCESALQRMIKTDIETGDPVFDERTRIEGDADRALAVLGDEARRLAEIVISGCQGEVTYEVIQVRLGDLQEAGSTLDLMLDLAQLLRGLPDREIPGLLAERALQDSSRGVRRQAFRQLASSYPTSEEARSIAEQLLEAPSAALRLEAGLVLLPAGPERSAEAAKTLFKLATYRHVDSAIRRSALEALAASRHRESATAAMTKALRQKDFEPPVVRRAALEGLVRLRARDELLEMQPAAAKEAEVLARGLGRLDIAAQPRLVELLEHAEDRVRLAAIDSLRRVGDIDSIAALRSVAGKDRTFKSAVARAAEQAIGEIKSRAGGSQRGEISLVRVEPLEGAVSEAGGEISLTP